MALPILEGLFLFMDMEPKSIYRILDANLNRSREGLRVVEEYVRFHRNDSILSEKLKALRQKLGRTPLSETDLISSRDTASDIGQGTYAEAEKLRTGANGIILPNLKRAQEALRVMEEYSKLIAPSHGLYFKGLRYELYVIEQELFLGLEAKKEILEQAVLYLVTAPSPELFRIIEEALQAGVRMVQLRNKTALGGKLLHQAKGLRELTSRYGALFIVNDRIDIALLSEADGVHLGQEDISLTHARKLLGKGKLVGISTHCIEEAIRAQEEGADYIGVGPIHATPTKAGRPSVGMEYLRQVKSKIGIPFFAIGGIDLGNLDEVIDAGAERVAVVRAVMETEEIKMVCNQFIQKLGHGRLPVS